MNADTGEFRALIEEVAALSRKVSTLTGRVTVMGNHVNDLDGSITDGEGVKRLIGILLEHEPRPWERRPPAKQAAPRPERSRHLRSIEGGQQ